MVFTPDSPFPKSRGHVIKSKDWNDAITEVQRLDTAKVNKAGDNITGPLTIGGNVGVGTTTPENSEGWERVLDVFGSTHAKLSVRNSGIDARMMAHGGVWGAPAGMVVGTNTNHSLSFGTNKVTRMTFDTAGNVGIGTTAPQGTLDVRGRILAGNSDIYFTERNHDHTGIGNTAGFAAIENAANFGALMILGRAGTERGRYVRLWDYLQVFGGMDVKGFVGIRTESPQVPLHVIGSRIRLGAGDARVVDLRADGSALDLESNGGELFINNNGVRVHIRNLVQGSSRDLKENITDFTAREATEALCGLKPILFNWKDDEEKTMSLGFVAEDTPGIATIPDKTAVIPLHILAILSKVVQEQQRMITSMREKLYPRSDA